MAKDCYELITENKNKKYYTVPKSSRCHTCDFEGSGLCHNFEIDYLCLDGTRNYISWIEQEHKYLCKKCRDAKHAFHDKWNHEDKEALKVYIKQDIKLSSIQQELDELLKGEGLEMIE